MKAGGSRQGSACRVRGVCAAVSLCGAVPLTGQRAQASRPAGLARGLAKLFFCFGFPCTLAGDSTAATAKAKAVLRVPGALVQKGPRGLSKLRSRPCPGGEELRDPESGGTWLCLHTAPVSGRVPGHLDPPRRGQDGAGPQVSNGLSVGWPGPGRMRLSRHQPAGQRRLCIPSPLKALVR